MSKREGKRVSRYAKGVSLKAKKSAEARREDLRKGIKMKSIIEQSGMTLKKFSEFYEIPYNTIRQWYNGERSAPSWVKKLIEKAAKGNQLEIEVPDFYIVETTKHNINGNDINYRRTFTDRKSAEEERNLEEHIKDITKRTTKLYEVKIIKR